MEQDPFHGTENFVAKIAAKIKDIFYTVYTSRVPESARCDKNWHKAQNRVTIFAPYRCVTVI
jgi:hypothetical protein